MSDTARWPHTEQSLAELLGVKKDDAASAELCRDLERIREAERDGWRKAARRLGRSDTPATAEQPEPGTSRP